MFQIRIHIFNIFVFYNKHVCLLYLLVVWLVAPHVREAVDDEGDVEGETKATVEHDEEGVVQRLAPEVPRHPHG